MDGQPHANCLLVAAAAGRSQRAAELQGLERDLQDLKQLREQEEPSGEAAAASPDEELDKLEEQLAAAQQQLAQNFGEQQLQARLQSLDGQVGQVWEALPAGSLLVVVSGQGDMREVQRLQEQRAKRLQRINGLPPWTQQEDMELTDQTAEAMRALCFCSVKK
jgi:DNA repair exonuclease SbcCD ATPase subunit